MKNRKLTYGDVCNDGELDALHVRSTLRNCQLNDKPVRVEGLRDTDELHYANQISYTTTGQCGMNAYEARLQMVCPLGQTMYG